MFVRKTILIHKSPNEIFPLINNFNSWPQWSPWLIADPNTRLDFENNGKYYRWKSEIIGSGSMQVLTEAPNESISYDLNFITPWKSQARVDMFLNKKKGGTEVVWTMKSQLPFYLFWMKKSMEIYVGLDYERGLLLLKDYAENGKVFSKLSFNKFKKIEETHYVGFRRACSFNEFKKHMTTDFQKMIPYVMEMHKESISGNPFSLYHKFDPIKNKVNYTIGVPVSKFLQDLEKDYFIGHLQTMKVNSILHTGKYEHLANAWSAQMMHLRSKQFKLKKGLSPFEVYLNSPQDTPENELETEVLFPVA